MAGRAATPPSDPLFGELPRDERLADKVAAALQDAIVSGRLMPGDRLPPERVLGESFGVSRTVIREAVRSLAAKGMIDIHSGSGSRVTSVGASAVSESMSLYLSVAGGTIDYAKVHEVRSLIEVQAAAMAALRGDREDIETIRRAHLEMARAGDDVDGIARCDLEFHRMVAQATHNELFLMMLDSMNDPLLAIRRVTLTLPGRPARASAAHEQILRGIEAHDVEAARAAMHEHLVESKLVLETAPRSPDGIAGQVVATEA